MDATTIKGIAISAFPSNPFAEQPMPSGDSCDGLGLFLDPVTNTFNLRQAHIACGPAAISNNFDLQGRARNYLYTGVGQYGMRSGLVQYVPDGIWNLHGNLTIAGPSNVEYAIYVMAGTVENHTNQAGILTGSPTVIGAGVGAWAGPSNMPFSIPFSAYKFGCAAGPGKATEISICVYPRCAGSAGVALAALGVDEVGDGSIPPNFISNCLVWRANSR